MGVKIRSDIFLGHNLFREANSFLHGTDNVLGQISDHIFAPNNIGTDSSATFIFQTEFRHGIKYNLFREYSDLENKFNFNSIV